MIGKVRHAWVSDRTRMLYMVLSALCLVHFLLQWLNTDGMSAADTVQFAVIALLTALLPLRPCVVAVMLLLADVVMVFAPFSDMGFIPGLAPMLLAAAALGVQWGSLWAGGVAVAVTEFAAAVQSVADFSYNDVVYAAISTAASLAPLSIAWAIGALVRWARFEEAERIKAQTAVARREKHLHILHVLHDSVANDLVYAVTQCRAARSAIAASQSVSVDADMRIDEIITVLERCLTQMRQQIIVPTKNELLGIAQGEERLGETPIATAAASYLRGDLAPELFDLEQVMREMGRRLRGLGFEGEPQISGHIAACDEDALRFVADAVREFGGNMAKYGRPGAYSLAVDMQRDGGVSISASNPMNDDAARSEDGSVDGVDDSGGVRIEASSSGSGLAVLAKEAGRRGGFLSCSAEDGEWTAYVSVPSAAAAAAIGLDNADEDHGYRQRAES